jgi:hypothetical protein
MILTPTIVIINLVHSKLGTNHPMAQQIIDKYTPEAENIFFAELDDSLESLDNFRKLLSNVLDEMKEFVL